MHGWFSKKQLEVMRMDVYVKTEQNNNNSKEDRVNPIKRYKTPTGEIVQVTMVSQTLDHKAKFDDMEYVAEVVEYVGSVKH